MSPPSHAQSFNRLCAAFPRQTIPPDTLRVYAAEVDDIPAAVFHQVVSKLIRTEEWLPTIASIRRAAAELMLQLPTEEDALVQVEARIRWGQQDPTTRGPRTDVHELVRAAVEHVGGWYAIRTSEQPGVVRGQFLKIYRNTRAAHLVDAQISDRVLEANGRPMARLVSG